MSYTLIGIIGAILLSIAWLPQISETIKKKRSDISPKFVILSFFATTLLLIYSILVIDWVFIFVNCFIFIQISISAYYEFIIEKRTRKNR